MAKPKTIDPPSITTTITTEKEYHWLISKDQLLTIFRLITPIQGGIPDNALVQIRVPSGADRSGMELDLNEVGGLRISWTKTTVEEPDGKKETR